MDIINSIKETRRENKLKEIKEVIEEESIEVEECDSFFEMLNTWTDFKDKYPDKYVESICIDRVGLFCVVVFEEEVVLWDRI